MTVFVVGLTGWWSNFFSMFRKPIELPLAIVRAKTNPNDVEIMQGHWKQWENFGRYIKLHYKDGDKVIALGHSYGSSAATHLCAFLADNDIDVDLFISEDQGADSWVIKDVPIGRNVEIVDEYLVKFERLAFLPFWNGIHNFTKLNGWHTAAFTTDKMVNMIAARILKVAKG